MHPEDRVLVGVMTRKKDFEIARDQHWYRVPEGKAPKGLYAEYVAFFFNGKFGTQKSGIHYYARRTGYELATRAQLLPEEVDHPRAQERYHKLQFGELHAKIPPILNPKKRRFSFIYTTWDRFVHAQRIDDLYSTADHLVDRVFYVLQDAGFRPQRRWELDTDYPPQTPHIRVLCENGEVIASPNGEDGIPIGEDIDKTVSQIQTEITRKGGPKMLPIMLDY